MHNDNNIIILLWTFGVHNDDVRTGHGPHVKPINHNIIIKFPKDTDDAYIIENIKRKPSSTYTYIICLPCRSRLFVSFRCIQTIGIRCQYRFHGEAIIRYYNNIICTGDR